MAQGSRPDRVGEQIRQVVSEVVAHEVKDPGIGLVTFTRVKVSPDLQVARIFYTTMGDEKARRETSKALDRATPFMRRQVASRVRLRRVPELHFQFDETIERQDRIERILLDLQRERDERAAADPASAFAPNEPGASTGTPVGLEPAGPESVEVVEGHAPDEAAPKPTAKAGGEPA